MSKIRAGILQAASDETAAPTDYTMETDWSTGSIPSGWTSLDANDTYTVDEGAYSSSTSAPAIWEYTDNTPPPFTSLSMIMAYTVAEWVQVDNVFKLTGNGDSPFQVYSRYWPGVAIDNHVAENNVDSQSNATDPSAVGIVVIAGTFHADGTLKLYAFHPGTAPIIQTGTWTPATVTPTALTVQASAYDSATPATGDSSDVKVKFTRFGLNEQYGDGELDDAGVQSYAETYGWTGPAFDPAAFVASAVVDQDFTGLSSTPGAWEVVGGTEDYNVDGLTQASGTALEMRLDMAGEAIDDLPGWLLINYAFPDVANAHIYAATENASGTRKSTLEFEGTGGIDFAWEMHRLESDNALDGFADGTNNFQIDNEADNEAWIGVRIYGLSDPSYTDGIQFLVTDPDGASTGVFSSNDYDQYEPDTLKWIRFILSGTGAGDVTIKRLLFWNDYGPSSFDDVSAVMAELGFTIP